MCITLSEPRGNTALHTKLSPPNRRSTYPSLRISVVVRRSPTRNPDLVSRGVVVWVDSCHIAAFHERPVSGRWRWAVGAGVLLCHQTALSCTALGAYVASPDRGQDLMSLNKEGVVR